MIEFPSCPQWYLEKLSAQNSRAQNTLSSVGFSQESQSCVFAMAEGVLISYRMINKRTNRW